MFYMLTVCYFVALGCCMCMKQPSITLEACERESKQNINRAVGIYMLAWALQTFIYLPVIVTEKYTGQTVSTGYDMCFILSIAINIPSTYMVMHALLQHKVNKMLWAAVLILPGILCAAWCALCPDDKTPKYIATALCIIAMAFLFYYYHEEYRHYVERIKSEYSEITGREIRWTWYCFAGFALQTCLYLLYQYHWNATLEYAYMLFSVGNATLLCFCTASLRPVSNKADSKDSEEMAKEEVQVAKDAGSSNLYALIEQKLETLCEKKMLFLEPDLTRETLCLRLEINRTYLSLYFRSRGTTYYQYINTLRIEYAIQLMKENPDMSIRDLSRLSGFKSQPTFRKVFNEVMGCLPSEFERK